jgi:hypothetical protein
MYTLANFFTASRRDVHHSFFDYAPIGKQKLFSEHPVCQRLFVNAFSIAFRVPCGDLGCSTQTLNDFAGRAFAGANSSLHIAIPEG